MKFSLERLFQINLLIKELAVGLKRLDFINNFESFETTVTIPANTEYSIRNELSFIPTKMLIMLQTGNALVTSGTTAWTSDYLYLKNHSGANSAVVKVLFFK